MPTPESVRWKGGIDGSLILLDQTRLPLDILCIECRDVETVYEAIRTLRVRGAPAIGIAAAFGVVVGLQEVSSSPSDVVRAHLDHVLSYLASSRPTAVNLFWALNRMRDCASLWVPGSSVAELQHALLREAISIHDEDRQMCHAIGRFGAPLIADPAVVLTHCNTGGLATSEYGTALSIFFTAQDQGKQLHVYVDETRPLLQGARLTAWELQQRQIPATLICDNMAAHVMRCHGVQGVFVGADRIAANGDTANKIGTYGLAVLAKAHGIPMYVAAPSSTFDLSIENGDAIPIEQRRPEEITEGFGKRTAPHGVAVYNPAFDVTPAELITAIITEQGIIQPVTHESIRAALAKE